MTSPAPHHPFDLSPWLQQQQRRVEDTLKTHLSTVDCPPKLQEAMAYSLLAGGKRLRPILASAFASSCSQHRNTQVNETVLASAMTALECIHTYSLIHDDLPAMDNDSLRRGKPTSHIVFGEALAILAGDALLTEAFVFLSADAKNPLQVLRVIETLSKAAGASGMIGGQVMDIDEAREATADYVFSLHRLKTGALIRAACEIGAHCSGGDGADLLAARSYGEEVGLAFQIADDVLDVTSSPELMGKPTGADAADGRHTFPAILGLEASIERAALCVRKAQAAVAYLEPEGGPLTALAAFALERKT
jgi:geranylgeranyl diphosphate synthase, type II